MFTTRILCSAVLIAALATVSTAAESAKTPKAPDATLTLDEGSVAAGIGFSWGSGTLTYQGKTYPVSVDGLTLGALGVTEASASGNVYGLKQLSDFSGVYSAVKVSGTLGKGEGWSTMRNHHGVVIELKASTAGAKITAGAGGVKLALKQ